METRQVPPPSELINEDSNYIKSLREAGFSMREVKHDRNQFNAVVYNKERQDPESPAGRYNIIFSPGALGESAGTTPISASFLNELGADANTVMGFNAALSFSGFEASKYNHNLNFHADQMVDYYKENIPDDEKDKPIVLVGHSMGGATMPIVARRLLEEGYNVRDVIMIAPPGLTERTKPRMVKDFIALNSGELRKPDLPALYPSPVDIANFSNRLKELTEKRDTKYLTHEETEELAYYELAILRQSEPDKLLLSNMSKDERDRVASIDEELQQLLTSQDSHTQDRIEQLQAERADLLIPNIQKVQEGTINGESVQQPPRAGALTLNFLRSLRQVKKTVGDLASEVTVGVVQDLIDYTKDHPEHKVDITTIAGADDPISGDYKVGEVNRIHVAPQTTYSEIGMHSFDHFTLPDDPVRVAQVLKRIIDRNDAATH